MRCHRGIFLCLRNIYNLLAAVIDFKKTFVEKDNREEIHLLNKQGVDTGSKGSVDVKTS